MGKKSKKCKQGCKAGKPKLIVGRGEGLYEIKCGIGFSDTVAKLFRLLIAI